MSDSFGSLTPPQRTERTKRARRARVTPAAVSPTPSNTIRFGCDIRVDVTEFATWPPENVRAFMQGIALMIGAREAARVR
jgi:hypothetical protein